MHQLLYNYNEENLRSRKVRCTKNKCRTEPEALYVFVEVEVPTTICKVIFLCWIPVRNRTGHGWPGKAKSFIASLSPFQPTYATRKNKHQDECKLVLVVDGSHRDKRQKDFSNTWNSLEPDVFLHLVHFLPFYPMQAIFSF
ncbi:unnamed protein product [Amoebophrya sp. A120]|nr:unnamed protein product [Amoebophrya sp. A120]|eukprot:GSA120T00004825001.1